MSICSETGQRSRKAQGSRGYSYVHVGETPGSREVVQFLTAQNCAEKCKMVLHLELARPKGGNQLSKRLCRFGHAVSFCFINSIEQRGASDEQHRH